MMAPGAGKQGLAGRVVVTLFLSPFLLVALLQILGLAHAVPLALLTLLYRPTPCDVVRSVVMELGEGEERTYQLSVRYEYEAKGRRRASDVVQRGYRPTRDPADAHRLLRTYQEGSRATCYVSPFDPSVAVLRRWNELLMPVALVVGMVAFLLCGLLPGAAVWIVWRGVPRLPAMPGDLAIPIAGLVMGGIGSLMGLGLIYVSQVGPYLRARAARSWVETPCEVVASEVRAHTSESKDGKGRRTTSTSYAPSIDYRYTFDGNPYRSNAYAFSVESHSERGLAEEVVARYAAGAPCTCFVDPVEHSVAVLDRSFDLQPLPIVFGLIFAGAGAVVMALTWRTRDRGPRRRGGTPSRLP